MTRKVFAVLVCISILFASLACQLLPGPNSPQAPTKENAPAANSNPTSTSEPTATVDTAATIAVEATATAQAAEKNAKATEEAQVLAATQEAAVKATDQAKQMLARTATAAGLATAQADDMYQLIQKLNSEGTITSKDGTYYKLDDFNENWAQLNWYQWWNTGYRPSEFVIHSHTAWESASKTANWFSSGCGFVFRAKDVDNHYMIFLALDGNVYLRGYVNGKYREFGKAYAGRLAPVKGDADVTLVVQGDHIVYYVNGQKVFDRHNSELVEGNLGLTLNSGTNKDFGTRCEMTDIELWELAEQQ